MNYPLSKLWGVPALKKDLGKSQILNDLWCLGRESNSYRDLAPRDFKSLASTNSATQAYKAFSIRDAVECQS